MCDAQNSNHKFSQKLGRLAQPASSFMTKKSHQEPASPKKVRSPRSCQIWLWVLEIV